MAFLDVLGSLAGGFVENKDPWLFYYKYLAGPFEKELPNFVLHAGVVESGGVTSFLSSVYFQGVVAEKEVAHAIAGVASGILKQVMPAEIDIVTSGTAMAYLLQPNIEGIPIFATQVTVSRSADIQEVQVTAPSKTGIGTVKGYFTDNVVPRARQWKIQGFLQSMILHLDTLPSIPKPSIQIQAEMLDVMARSNLPVLYKDYASGFHRVAIESLTMSDVPGEINSKQIEINLKEVVPYYTKLTNVQGANLIRLRQAIGNEWYQLNKDRAPGASQGQDSAPVVWETDHQSIGMVEWIPPPIPTVGYVEPPKPAPVVEEKVEIVAQPDIPETRPAPATTPTGTVRPTMGGALDPATSSEFGNELGDYAVRITQQVWSCINDARRVSFRIAGLPVTSAWNNFQPDNNGLWKGAMYQGYDPVSHLRLGAQIIMAEHMRSAWSILGLSEAPQASYADENYTGTWRAAVTQIKQWLVQQCIKICESSNYGDILPISLQELDNLVAEVDTWGKPQ